MTARKPAVRRCGARTRAGAPCRNPAATGRKRCRMHGGAKGSGAPRGNRNALAHGFYSRAAAEARKRFGDMVAAMEGEMEEGGIPNGKITAGKTTDDRPPRQ